MKLYGSITELVAAVFRKDSQNITLRPNQGVTYTGATDIQLPPELTAQVLVSADSTQTLTNKSISGATNTLSGISLSSMVTGVLPSANGGTGVANSTTLTLGANNITFATSGATSVTLPATGVLATLSGTETLNNKVIANTSTILVKDSLLTIQDDGDTTKTLQFQLSGITTGTLRTLTVPDASMTLLGRADTATVSNKLLDNTNTATLLDGNVVLESTADTTKTVKFSLTGITTATQRVMTLPDANTTLVGTAVTQTLTNKTIDGSANTLSNVNLASSVTGTLPIANGGTGQTAKTAAFNALSPITTKGDIESFDGTNVVRLGVGADGTVLSADSTQTSGLRYVSVLSNPMTTVGDVIVGGTAGAATRLAVGASGTVLKGGTTPSYAAITNADVSASAAIAGTKISPVFGSQNLTMTGNATITGTTDSTSFTVNSNATAITSDSTGFLINVNPANGNITRNWVVTGSWSSGGGAQQRLLADNTQVLVSGGLLKVGPGANSGVSTSATLSLTQYGTITSDTSSGFLLFGSNGAVSTSTSTANMWLDAQGQVHIRNITTVGSAANTFIDASTGQFSRSTSSLRYKTNVLDLATSDSESLYGLRPITFQSKNAPEGDTTKYLGFIAEEADLIQPLLVQYSNGVPDGFQYDRVVVLLVSEIKKLRDRITALEAK